MIKIRSIALIGTALCALSSVAHAGFEFMPSSSGEQQQAAPAAQEAAPMPIVPVEQQSLSGMPVLPAIPVTAQPLPPMDMVSPPPAPSPIPMKAAVNNSGQLVINPYPLQASNMDVTHGGNDVYVEQAMMQEAGALRGISAPGANYTSQITNNAQNIALTKAPKVYAQAPVSAPNNYGGLTPMMGGEAAPMVPAPVISATPLAPVPRAPQPAPVTPSVSGLEEAVGFGKELPLALALSQVVPSDYSFSFGQNVNVGSTVSWQGGKSWDAVLQEMLAPVGMKAVISGKQVVIQNAA